MCRQMDVLHWIVLISLQLNQLTVGQGVYNPTSLLRILDTVKIQNPGRELAVASNCSSEPRCWCGENAGTVVADCSALNLTTIPDFIPTVNIIDLRHNMIAVLNNTDHLPLNLLWLDLSNNRLTNFTNSAPFKDLVNLTGLDISGNSLKYLPSIYTSNVFTGLKSLTFLNLNKNNVKYSDQYRYPSTISTLRDLTSLNMDGLRNVSLGQVLSPLTKLTTIDLSGEVGSCWINKMAENFFEGVASSLREVYMSKCDIRYIEKGTFRSFPNLTVLNLSGNTKLTFHVLRNLTYDLQFTSIRRLYLNQLHCTYGIGTFLFEEDAIFLNNTKLEELHLDFNRIEMVEYTMITYLPDSLKILSVAGNKFTLGRYLLAMRTLKSLKYLNVSLQFGQHGSLNEMLGQCFDWRCPKYVENFDQESIPLELFDETPGRPYLYFPPNLEVLDCYSSSFRGTIGFFSFMEKNKIKRIDAHDNLFHTWKGPVRNLHQVECIDLSYNSCGNVTNQFFEDFPRTKRLFISNNNLGEVFKNDTNGDILKHLTSLETLDISHNKIYFLSTDVFRGLGALTHLNLSFNQLTDVDFDIQHMHHLQLVNVSYNRLLTLPQIFMDTVDRLITMTNLMLDLRGNLLRCDCSGLTFLKWMNRRKSHFQNITQYECSMADQTRLLLGQLEDIIAKLDRDCSDYIGLIAGTLVVIVICISLVISGLVYRFRWKLRYLYYMARNKYRGYDVIRDRSGTTDSQYMYDAFVSYSHSDSSFVIQNIIENLETTRGLRLCLHQRDFLPGNEIAVNITSAINNSRRTIAVITNSYLDSYWCMFEFNMARMESVYTRGEDNVLFLILFEKFSRRQIPLDVLDVIESDSYIEYPDDEQGNVVFWDKIHEAISG